MRDLISSIKNKEIYLLLVAPLLFTVHLSVLMQANQFGLEADSILTKVINRITLGDAVILVILLLRINYWDRHRSIFSNPAYLLVAFSLIIFLIALSHLVITPTINFDILFLLRSFYIFVLALLFLQPKYTKVDSKTYFQLLIFFLIIIIVLALIAEAPIYNILPSYSDYLDIMVYRFKGLSDNTNNFALGIFGSSILYFLFRGKEPLNKYDLLTMFLLFFLALITKGRHAFLIVVLELLVLSRYLSWARPPLLILVLALTVILSSIRINVIPINDQFPFINTDRSSYSIVHDGYLRMIKTEATFLGKNRNEIRKRYIEYSDNKAIMEVIEKRSPSKSGKVEYANYFSKHASTHSMILELTLYYGLLGIFLFFSLNSFLIYKYYSLFRTGFETQLLLLNTVGYLFMDSSRISWLVIFGFYGYFIIYRRVTHSL